MKRGLKPDRERSGPLSLSCRMSCPDEEGIETGAGQIAAVLAGEPDELPR